MTVITAQQHDKTVQVHQQEAGGRHGDAVMRHAATHFVAGAAGAAGAAGVAGVAAAGAAGMRAARASKRPSYRLSPYFCAISS
ncbi:MAG: hypothetical protein EOP81_01495 [Variovorax sp.]|nr:MAG: hypothetical protein EOP81_01495 [Variovorax sp.]